LDVAELLVDKGAELNIRESNGWSPFHLACDTESVSVAEMLSERGADVNVQDNVSHTVSIKFRDFNFSFYTSSATLRFIMRVLTT